MMLDMRWSWVVAGGFVLAAGCVVSEPVGGNPDDGSNESALDEEGGNGSEGDGGETGGNGGTGSNEGGGGTTGDPDGGDADAGDSGSSNGSNGSDGSDDSGDSGDSEGMPCPDNGPDDDFVCVPTDQMAPTPFYAIGGDVDVSLSGPGPWPGAPDTMVGWSKDYDPDDSDGMNCQWGDTQFSSGYEVRSSDYGEGFSVLVRVPEFDAAGTYVVDGSSDGLVQVRWSVDIFDDPDDDALVSTAVGGTCAVTVDPLWWTGSVSCTGLQSMSGPDVPQPVGPIDLEIQWACAGITEG